MFVTNIMNRTVCTVLHASNTSVIVLKLGIQITNILTYFMFFVLRIVI